MLMRRDCGLQPEFADEPRNSPSPKFTRPEWCEWLWISGYWITSLVFEMHRALLNLACLLGSMLLTVAALFLLIGPTIGQLLPLLGIEIESPASELFVPIALGSAVFVGAFSLGLILRARHPMAWIFAYGAFWAVASLFLGLTFVSGHDELILRYSTMTLLSPASAMLAALSAARVAARFNRARTQNASS
ncbi:hypothetical protein LNV23_20395 [Paucibacter sp. DJ1R-11]|uniref:hypothetical protein n=1 Tax=Paucibacter sp. DJ1R-11 TaxID=2893556 RepID=UPI0021E3783D|nr:hypothetical protein [Paucibacter sp. DJ1R-11]MCV2365816.1 hypothetical protein [Paucibacter sp. DJ1R-11]